MEPENSGAPEGETAPGPSRRPAKLVLILVIVLAAVVAGFLLLRRGGPGPAAPAAPASKAAPSQKAVTAVLVKLSPEAALVADRFNCLCGDCQDTLGKCTCTHDRGSDEMKATLNRIVAEKKTLSGIEAAMVEKYGPGVLAASHPSPPSPGK
jgi:hypothetical protein